MSLMADRLIGALLIVFSIALYINSRSFPIGSETFPQAMLATIFLFSVFLIAGTFKSKAGAGQEREKKPASRAASPYLTYAQVVLYVLLIRPLGFFVASALFIAGMMYFLGVRCGQIFLYTIIGFATVIYLLFVTQLKVPLPHGILF